MIININVPMKRFAIILIILIGVILMCSPMKVKTNYLTINDAPPDTILVRLGGRNMSIGGYGMLIHRIDMIITADDTIIKADNISIIID